MATSSGILPQIFAAEGTTVDLQWLTSADVSITGRSYEDVVFLGSDTGDLTRTVSGNGRFTITGSAGEVLFRVGDPSPDNSGGTLTIEGWAGTQGDTLTLDFALLNTTGRVKENSRKLNGVVQTEATTFTTAATVDIPLSNTPTGVRAWRITIYDLIPSTASQPRLRISYAASLKSGASDYAYGVEYWNSAGSTFGQGEDDANDYIALLGENLNALANKPARIVIDVVTPNSGSDATLIDWTVGGYTTEATPVPTKGMGFGYGLGNYGRADSIRLYPSAGTITGKYVVEALYGYGD